MRYFYPGELFSHVQLSNPSGFGAPASLPDRYVGLSMAVLAAGVPDDPSYGYWPLRDVTAIDTGYVKAGTFSDAANGADKKIDRTHDLVALPPPSQPPLLVDPSDFILLFPPEKAAAIFDSTDARVRQFVRASAARTEKINLKSANLAAMLAYLVSQSLITAEERAAIIAGTPPA